MPGLSHPDLTRLPSPRRVPIHIWYPVAAGVVLHANVAGVLTAVCPWVGWVNATGLAAAVNEIA